MQTTDDFKSKDKTRLEQNLTVPPQEAVTTEPGSLPATQCPCSVPLTSRPTPPGHQGGMTVSLALARESQSDSDRASLVKTL